jgi:hypothetical protein
MKRISRQLFFIGLAFIFTSCTSSPKRAGELTHAQLIEQNTQSADKYNGFYQTFRASLTMLTPEVISSNLQERAKFLKWPDDEYQRQREKALQESATQAKFFLKFFTPEQDYDDLSHGNSSMWRIFLEYSGRRFEAKITKVKKNLSELGALYPHFDRFSTPYEVVFPVSMTDLVRYDSKVIITSSLGQAEFDFKAQQ